MKKFSHLITILMLAVCLLCACSDSEAAGRITPYTPLTPAQAKEIIDNRDSYIILDVRTDEEYKKTHIPGAVNIPVEEIKDRGDRLSADKDTVILVYCENGVRSKQAAQELADMGYTSVYEFGGISTWPYEIISGDVDITSLILGETPVTEENGLKAQVTGWRNQIVEIKLENNSGSTATYGAAYTLEILEDGQYRQMEWKNEPVWIMISFDLENGQSDTASKDLSLIKDLGPGSYRLHTGPFTAEFTLVSKE